MNAVRLKAGLILRDYNNIQWMVTKKKDAYHLWYACVVK